MKSRFDRLCKTIFESVKPRPSKRNLNRILKEDVNDQNTISITPEQRAIIEKVVAELCTENQDYKDTVEFAKLDTDYFVALLDGCYEDWCEEQGYDDDQPDLFDDKPGFEEFAKEAIEDALWNYDADEEGTADDIIEEAYKLKKELYHSDFIEVLKSQKEAFMEACRKLITNKNSGDSWYLDMALRDTTWWKKNNLQLSPELEKKVDYFARQMDYIYADKHIFAASDYEEWDDPEAVLEGLGLQDWYKNFLKEGDQGTFNFEESKKVNTSKKVIRESAKRHARRIRK